jgi:hypothetical protein
MQHARSCNPNQTQNSCANSSRTPPVGRRAGGVREPESKSGVDAIPLGRDEPNRPPSASSGMSVVDELVRTVRGLRLLRRSLPAGALYASSVRAQRSFLLGALLLPPLEPPFFLRRGSSGGSASSKFAG